MLPGNPNLDDSTISLINKATQTDATDSFLENYYVRFRRSQNASAVQSENSLKLRGHCQNREGGGTVTIKNNTIIIKEAFRRNSPSLVENLSQDTGPSDESTYCEEVLIPYLKTPPPDCELNEHLTIEFPEEIPDHQPDIITMKKDMKDSKSNSSSKCDVQNAAPPVCKPATTELTDVGKRIVSAVIIPICKNCETVNAHEPPDVGNDPCEKQPGNQQLSNVLSTVSQGIKIVQSKMMSAICPCKSPGQSTPIPGKAAETPPVEKAPETPPPEPVVSKSESTSSVKSAYKACKQKTICVAKGVRSSLSNLLCTPCPCPKPLELPVPCSSINSASPSENARPLICLPQEEIAPASDSAIESVSASSETPPGAAKKDNDTSKDPCTFELPPCPPEDKLPCQPNDAVKDLPPCKKKVIVRPPCPPDPDNPPCLPKKNKCKSKEKENGCPPKEKCKIKDPVMAVKMPTCKSEKPIYYLTEKAKICKSCDSVSFDVDSQNQVNALTLENQMKSSNGTISNLETEDVHFDATRTYKTDLTMQNNFDKDSFHSLKRLSSIHKNNKNNSDNYSSITTEPSTQSGKVVRVASLNDINVNGDKGNITESQTDQGLSLKDRVVKPLRDVKDSVTNLFSTLSKANEPTPVLSDESQLIKVTETASTENKSPNIMNLNRNSNTTAAGQKSEDDTATIDRASIMIAPTVTRLADAVDSTVNSLKKRTDLDSFSSTIKETINENSEHSSPYDKESVRSVATKELISTDSEPIPEEPSSLPKSVFTTIKSKLFGMFSDRERTDDVSNGARPVLERTSRASVRFKNNESSSE